MVQPKTIGKLGFEKDCDITCSYCYFSTYHWLATGLLLTGYRHAVGLLLAGYGPAIGMLLTCYRPAIGRPPSVFWTYIGRIQAGTNCSISPVQFSSVDSQVQLRSFQFSSVQFSLVHSSSVHFTSVQFNSNQINLIPLISIKIISIQSNPTTDPIISTSKNCNCTIMAMCSSFE